MKTIEKKKKQDFCMFMVQFSLGCIIIHGGVLCWLVSLIHIGPVTLLIESIVYVMFSALVMDLSLRPVRNIKLFLFLLLKHSTEKQLMQAKKPYGFNISF
jgi:mannitol-specific phosphotransferase system IIBC component